MKLQGVRVGMQRVLIAALWGAFLACPAPLPELIPPVDRCGDGRLSAGEACDDGNTWDGDACTRGCQNARCGDGILRVDLGPEDLGYEACDDGNIEDRDACTNSCLDARCGDGLPRRDRVLGETGYEACDDGNDNDQDDCTVYCAPPRCGDGILHAGEACDDGNGTETDECLNTCVLASCGDGILHAGEACDDGNAVEEDACLSNCLEARCGDGVVHLGEACDDGNDAETDACLSNCQAASCGDGYVREDLEACDDGNLIDEDACTAGCDIARCGDGITRTDLGAAIEGYEACDDGNDAPMDGCSIECRMDDHGDHHGTATILTEEGASGAIQSVGDQDYFRWSSPVPGMYRFTVTSVTPESGDAVILFCGLRDEEDQVLDQMDAQPDRDFSPELEVTLAANEVVYLLIKPLDEELGTGAYEIAVQTTCGNGVVEDHESCDPADPLIRSFSCREDCEWRRSLMNGWATTCYRQQGRPWCTGDNSWASLGSTGNLSRCFWELGGQGFWAECSRGPLEIPGFVMGLRDMAQGNGVGCYVDAHSNLKCNGAIDNALGSTVNWNESVPCPRDPNRQCIAAPQRVHANTFWYVHGVALSNLAAFALVHGDVRTEPQGTGRRGRLFAWGLRAFGVLGLGPDLRNPGWLAQPREIAMPVPEDPVLYAEGSAFDYTVCALTESKALYCWGRNGLGQAGASPTGEGVQCAAYDGHPEQSCVPSPQRVEGLPPVLDFAVGGSHTCALSEGSEVYCWGSNQFGQLGVGGQIEPCNPDFSPVGCMASPQSVNLPEAVDIAAGYGHSCAVLANGRVSCWGSGDYHALGLGRTDLQREPRMLGRIHEAREVSAGMMTTCARKQDQSILCWGRNDMGQVGANTPVNAIEFPRLVQFD